MPIVRKPAVLQRYYSLARDHFRTLLRFRGVSKHKLPKTLSLFDVSTALASLAGGSGSIPAFTDLGTGTVFGSLVVDNAAGQFIDITLNPAGLTYLNGLGGGTGIFGASITTLAKGAAPNNEIIFNGTSSTLTRQLILQTDADSGVPEPANWGVAAIGMLLLVGATKWTRNASNAM